MSEGAVRRWTSRLSLSQWLALALLLLIVFMPMYWVLITSLKGTRQILMSESIYYPNPPTLQHYIALFSESRFLRWLVNSVFVAFGSTAIALVAGCLGAYALTRLRFPGKKMLASAVMITYLLPPGLMFIPLYQIFIKVNFTNSLGTLIAAYPSFTVPFSTWFLMSFFRAIPHELEEAALIDGATRLQAFVRVVLPLAVPGILAAGLFCFTLAWNEFLYALIFISSDRLRTLPVGLNEFLTADVYNWGQLMGAAFLAALPVVVFYIYLQKYMIQGLTAGAVKG
jgi:multiple sugar transport system permease protein